MTTSATICVIDDNPDNVDLLEQELSDAGYRVVTALSGEFVRRLRAVLSDADGVTVTFKGSLDQFAGASVVIRQ